MSGENINSQLLKSGCFCLNEDTRAPHTNLFVGDHTLPLRSDADEQLLLHLAFNQTIKLSRVEIGIPNDESCPQHLKLFVNQNNLGFDDASEGVATQTFTVAPGTATVTIDLAVAKWQRAESITIFVEDNHGADATVLHSLKLFGTAVMGTDVANIHNKNKECNHE